MSQRVLQEKEETRREGDKRISQRLLERRGRRLSKEERRR
jgi:hypothetical protein